MNILCLTDPPAPALAAALEVFESQFVYPLGPGRSFRISHGNDYPRFFRAIGGRSSAVFVAQHRDGRVLGTVGVAIRALVQPDGDQRRAAYVGDLKVAPAARSSPVYLRLALAGLAWGRPRADAAYGVVMDGTASTPPRYTGRAGIPGFASAGELAVIRYPCGSPASALAAGDAVASASDDQGAECFRSLSRGRYAPSVGGDLTERSEMTMMWLATGDGAACGRLEDTRRAKRLIEVDAGGAEMRSAHLACFAWRSPNAAVAVIQTARREAATRGFPALFVCVAARELAPLDAAIGDTDRVVAPATVYAAGLDRGPDWNINSSEI